jgi:hypothetical protein
MYYAKSMAHVKPMGRENCKFYTNALISYVKSMGIVANVSQNPILIP